MSDVTRSSCISVLNIQNDSHKIGIELNNSLYMESKRVSIRIIIGTQVFYMFAL